MATVTEIRYTPDDLLNITDRPMPELVDGELVEREMGQESDMIGGNCFALLWIYVRAHQLGIVNGAQGSYQVFPDDPKKVRIPDVSFTRKERLTKDQVAKGHGRVTPDLVVEVISPNDTATCLNDKINDFLSVGVPLIWIVCPETQTVQVHRLDGSGQRLRLGDVLDGEDILPGFRCPVADLFA